VMEIACKDCPYCWKDEDDRYPTCHFFCNDPWGVAPCEEEPDVSEYEPW